MPLSPFRGFISGRGGFLGSKRVFTNRECSLLEYCMLFNEWAWLMSRVCLLRLEVVLAGSGAGFSFGARAWTEMACIGISSENNSAFKGFERAYGPCEGWNLGRIVCVAEVHLSPNLLFDPAWVVTQSKWAINLSMAMNIINNQSDTVWHIGTGRWYHYRLVETNSGQLSILIKPLLDTVQL